MTSRIINADVMDGLAGLSDESVHCCVTSPPYWGLRDYGTASWVGGDAACDHKEGRQTNRATGKNATNPATSTMQVKADCRCGAVRVDQQIGLEPTPDAFVARMVGVFREVRRVLRKDGTCWVNLGDSYVTAPPGNKAPSSSDVDGQYARKMKRQLGHGEDADAIHAKAKLPGLKSKDLIGIPWRVALALQADGWWLRSDIIWHKPNPMPESVTDRPTKSHEYLFLLAKNEKYWYDADAIREAGSPDSEARYAAGYKQFGKGQFNGSPTDGRAPKEKLPEQLAHLTGRNKRSVWSIATAPFSEAHFATFPPELPEICIKAGCPIGGTVLDPFCGAGTTLLVADRLQRHGIGIELNSEYAAMATRRIGKDRGGLLDIMEMTE